MFNVHKEKLLKQMDETEWNLWCADLALIKLLIDYIASFRTRPRKIFRMGKDYNSSYYCSTNKKSFEDDEDFACNFLYVIGILDEIERVFPLLRYPLYLEIFVDGIDTLKSKFDIFDYGCLEQDMVNALNECIQDIYHQLKNKDIRVLMARSKVNVNHRFTELEGYVNELFTSYARLMVIRLDFGYREEIETTDEMIGNHRDKLLRYLREKHNSNAVVGYVWKLEYGLRKGYHLHCVIFMNGSKVQQSIIHGKIIGDYWNSNITGGSGTAYNCNAKMGEYKNCGIGMVHWNDEIKRRHLIKACEYLTKPDEFIELLHQHHNDIHTRYRGRKRSIRTYGKGQLPSKETTRGRPRSLKISRLI